MERFHALTLVAITAPLLWVGAGPLWADELDAAIAQHRMGTLVVEAAPGAEISIEQIRHEFWFGAALSSVPFADYSRMTDADKKRYREVFLDNFNAAVTENAVKWKQMEPKRGAVNYSIVDAILDF